MKSIVIGLIVALLVCNAYAHSGNSRMIRNPNNVFQKSTHNKLDSNIGVTGGEAMAQFALHDDNSNTRDLQQSSECQECNLIIWDVHFCKYGKDSKQFGTFIISTQIDKCFKDTCCASNLEDCCNSSSANATPRAKATPYVAGYIVGSVVVVLMFAVILFAVCENLRKL